MKELWNSENSTLNFRVKGQSDFLSSDICTTFKNDKISTYHTRNNWLPTVLRQWFNLERRFWYQWSVATVSFVGQRLFADCLETDKPYQLTFTRLFLDPLVYEHGFLLSSKIFVISKFKKCCDSCWRVKKWKEGVWRRIMDLCLLSVMWALLIKLSLKALLCLITNHLRILSMWIFFLVFVDDFISLHKAYRDLCTFSLICNLSIH